MKKLLLALALVTSVSAFGQGRFAWSTVSTTDPTLLLSTNKLGVTGLMAGGANQYYIAIFTGAAASDMTASAAPALVVANHATLAGKFAGATISGPAVPTDFQVRAWSANVGNTWAAAAAAWRTQEGFYGASKVGSVTPTVAPTAAPTIWGTGPGQIQGFEVVYVPEPSTLALGGLGLLGLYLIRRRK